MTAVSAIDPTTHTIHLSAAEIAAGQIIALARQLDATECPGAFGDDNQNGWFGLKPKWKFVITLPGEVEFSAVVVKLMQLGRPDEFTVVAWPKQPGCAVLPAVDREGGIYSKHTGSQLDDCAFEIGFLAAKDEVWVRCRTLDTALLRGTLLQRTREELLQRADDNYRQRPTMFSSEAEMEEAIHRHQELLLQSYIDPAARVFFVCAGHVFRVDRSGPELVLVPKGEKQ